MATAKSNQEIKREKRREKRETIDRLTNGYMINLAWGILGIVALRFVESGYASANTILVMPVVMKTLAAVFAIIAIGLFVLGSVKTIRNHRRITNYAFFSVTVALVSLWIGFFQNVRLVAVKLVPALYTIDSRWWISWGPIVALVVYLIIALIWTGVRIAAIEKGKTKSK